MKKSFFPYLKKHRKYAPILFFVGGFIFDTLTLGRIDRLYDVTVLTSHMTCLSLTLYLFNLAGDGKWKNTFLGRVQEYFPLAIQFFFGALSSAYVVYFSRSVSLSKTISFFIILVALLVANEFLKKRIANKYLQFGVYYFISFTFFSFMIPVFIKEMNTSIFILSGIVSLGVTLTLISFIYWSSPSTRKEVSLYKLVGLVFSIYILINTFYFFKLIPPVPLALDEGIVAHDIVKENDSYIVSYETNDWYVFWRKHRLEYIHTPATNVYIFSSIFAPTQINKKIFHSWQWFNEKTKEWQIMEELSFDAIGGRERGFRGFTFKKNVKEGIWRVKVMTEEQLVLGVINFELIIDENEAPQRVVNHAF
ncbi:MAG: DUF2914 domain-containing protein [Cyclobacteriaceae bacterium]